MKHKFLKIFTLVFCCALFLTGCGSLAMIKDTNGNDAFFAEPVYFQGQVAQVEDYLFYGSSFADVTADGFNYKSAAKNGYLSRINLANLDFDDNVDSQNYKHSTPNGSEKVAGKLASYTNQEMFAYGQYLYFTSANVHKTSDMENDYSRISLFRVKFNGKDLKEIDTFTYDEESSLSLQKGSDGNYYFVIVCPSEIAADEDKTYDISSIKIGNKIGKTEILAEKVNSAVVADENSTQKTVVYTVDSKEDRTSTVVNSVDFATGDIEELDRGTLSASATLLGREGDIVFYSYSYNKINQVYYKDVTVEGTFYPSTSQKFYDATSISNIIKVNDGYAFTSDTSNALMYKTIDGSDATLLVEGTAFKDVLFADGDYVYISNESSIMRKSVRDGEVETLVKDMTIKSGECGYADGYIYFYAQRGKLVLEEGEEQKEDTNYYLYQVDKEGNVQLIGNVA